MTIQLQQMHPAAVHLPIALLPLAVGADLIGCATGSRALHAFGQKAIRAAYLGVGAAGIGILAYTAYLGGTLVYDFGVGVQPAKGVYRDDAPALRAGQLGAFFRTAGTDLVAGVEHMVEELRKGQFVPAIATWCRKHCGA